MENWQIIEYINLVLKENLKLSKEKLFLLANIFAKKNKALVESLDNITSLIKENSDSNALVELLIEPCFCTQLNELSFSNKDAWIDFCKNENLPFEENLDKQKLNLLNEFLEKNSNKDNILYQKYQESVNNPLFSNVDTSIYKILKSLCNIFPKIDKILNKFKEEKQRLSFALIEEALSSNIIKQRHIYQFITEENLDKTLLLNRDFFNLKNKLKLTEPEFIKEQIEKNILEILSLNEEENFEKILLLSWQIDEKSKNLKAEDFSNLIEKIKLKKENSENFLANEIEFLRIKSTEKELENLIENNKNKEKLSKKELLNLKEKISILLEKISKSPNKDKLNKKTIKKANSKIKKINLLFFTKKLFLVLKYTSVICLLIGLGAFSYSKYLDYENNKNIQLFSKEISSGTFDEEVLNDIIFNFENQKKYKNALRNPKFNKLYLEFVRISKKQIDDTKFFNEKLSLLEENNQGTLRQLTKNLQAIDEIILYLEDDNFLCDKKQFNLKKLSQIQNSLTLKISNIEKQIEMLEIKKQEEQISTTIEENSNLSDIKTKETIFTPKRTIDTLGYIKLLEKQKNILADKCEENLVNSIEKILSFKSQILNPSKYILFPQDPEVVRVLKFNRDILSIEEQEYINFQEFANIFKHPIFANICRYKLAFYNGKNKEPSKETIYCLGELQINSFDAETNLSKQSLLQISDSLDVQEKYFESFSVGDGLTKGYIVENFDKEDYYSPFLPESLLSQNLFYRAKSQMPLDAIEILFNNKDNEISNVFKASLLLETESFLKQIPISTGYTFCKSFQDDINKIKEILHDDFSTKSWLKYKFSPNADIEKSLTEIFNKKKDISYSKESLFYANFIKKATLTGFNFVAYYSENEEVINLKNANIDKSDLYAINENGEFVKAYKQGKKQAQICIFSPIFIFKGNMDDLIFSLEKKLQLKAEDLSFKNDILKFK